MSDKKMNAESLRGNALRTVIGSLFQHRRRFNQVDSVVVGDDPGSAQYLLGAGCGMLHASGAARSLCGIRRCSSVRCAIR